MKNTDKARKPGRKKPASRKQLAAAQYRRKGFWRILLRLALLGLVLLAGWMVYLDAHVTSRRSHRALRVAASRCHRGFTPGRWNFTAVLR